MAFPLLSMRTFSSPLMNPFQLSFLGFAFLLSSVALTSQAQATCSAVTNLITTSLSSSSVSVSATSAADATSYIIICTIYPTTASVGILFNSVNVPSPAYTFTGLPVGTSYIICINTLCAPGQQQGSACSPRTAPLATHNAVIAEQVVLSPNPAHHTTTLTLTLPAKLGRGSSATLLNSLGQVVRQYLLPASPTATLDLADVALGVYSVKLQAGDEWITKRLVVQ
jgi:hypothetical protein